LEDEIDMMKPFRKALQSEEELEAFDDLMDMCRNFASEAAAPATP